MSEQQPQLSLHDLIQDLDLTIPLDELIEDPAILTQPIEFDQQELARLDELARDCVQELAEKGMIPELPPMDIDSTLLEPGKDPFHREPDYDFGR